ncbi:peptidoglycan-binding protein [Clostridium sp. SHJSY1]|uniref:GH25 family lysozyme n=1 Tax=Clostridium sp. SHJSY1 TaxID=2942483 RepID=UPI0028749FD7|nr:GH25 family lysozyme [Clostridium sp. SHJSY1]MDS0525447.1 peptidoglycan-binding protein [Clostridium sp. SHJSY1]
MRKLKRNISLLLAAFMVAFFIGTFPVQAYSYKGIDISDCNWDNGGINFNTVRSSGVEFAYIKATEGTTYQDPHLSANYNGATSVGLKVGFYHFLVGSSEPETQAENFYNQIKNRRNDLKPCLDIEYSRNQPSNFMNYAIRFIARFKQLSDLPLCIYSGPSFIDEQLDSRLAQYPLWVANYGVNTPMSNKVWGSSYVGHQYAAEAPYPGYCPGVNGFCDLDNFNEGVLIDSNYTPQPVPQLDYSDINIYSQLQAELNRQGFGDLDIDGIAGPLTLDACPLIRKGAEGNLTQWIQLRVGANADGIFGQDTKNAVRWFQESRGISADGVVGNDTWRELLAL